MDPNPATFQQLLAPARQAAMRAVGDDDRQSLLDFIARAQITLSERDEMKGRVAELEEQLRFKGTLRFQRNVMESDDPNDPGPFCPGCWDGPRKAVHLIDRWGNGGYYTCPVCKTAIETDPGRPPAWTPMKSDIERTEY